MFSANENIMLRQHKRRIIQYVEDCIPEDVLDLGTAVMVMQVSCKAPGCVPLETAICVVFPNTGEPLPIESNAAAFIQNNTLKTKILMPMTEVTKEDVLDALPPPFGRRTLKMLHEQARDVMLGQITQLMDDDDVDGRKLMAEYLQECLREYVERGCQPPEHEEEHVVTGMETEGTKEDSNGDKGEADAATKRSAKQSQEDPVKLQSLSLTGAGSGVSQQVPSEAAAATANTETQDNAKVR